MVCALFVFVGMGLNDLDLKYSKVNSPTRRCRKELFILSIPDSAMCCDEAYHDVDWVCAASFGPSHRVFSSLWALLFPLLPFIATVGSDLIASIHDARNGLCPVHMAVVKAHCVRFSLYAIIILYRTYVLYLAGAELQNRLQSSTIKQDCWYSSLVKDGNCREKFDYSDHIVLYMAQYAVPISIELAYVYSRSNFTRSYTLFKYFMTVLSSVVLLGICIRGVLLTSMYFHSAVESFAGLLVVLLCLIGPLYFLADKTSLWADIAMPAISPLNSRDS